MWLLWQSVHQVVMVTSALRIVSVRMVLCVIQWMVLVPAQQAGKAHFVSKVRNIRREYVCSKRFQLIWHEKNRFHGSWAFQEFLLSWCFLILTKYDFDLLQFGLKVQQWWSNPDSQLCSAISFNANANTQKENYAFISECINILIDHYPMELFRANRNK